MRELLIASEFMEGHPQSGKPTFFYAKIKAAIYGFTNKNIFKYFSPPIAKFHTITKGNRWSEGDFFNLKEISDAKGVQNPLIENMEVTKTYDVFICPVKWRINVNGREFEVNEFADFAANEGLALYNFFKWFGNEPFEGQIVCFTKNYPVY